MREQRCGRRRWNGNKKPSKKRSRERIDGVSALATALALAIVDTHPARVYEANVI